VRCERRLSRHSRRRRRTVSLRCPAKLARSVSEDEQSDHASPCGLRVALPGAGTGLASMRGEQSDKSGYLRICGNEGAIEDYGADSRSACSAAFPPPRNRGLPRLRIMKCASRAGPTCGGGGLGWGQPHGWGQPRDRCMSLPPSGVPSALTRLCVDGGAEKQLPRVRGEACRSVMSWQPRR
jgi:hypothetical protein